MMTKTASAAHETSIRGRTHTQDNDAEAKGISAIADRALFERPVNWVDYPGLPPVLSLKEFRTFFCIGRTKTWEEIKYKRLRAVRVGRRTTIRAVDAIRWYESYKDGDG